MSDHTVRYIGGPWDGRVTPYHGGHSIQVRYLFDNGYREFTYRIRGVDPDRRILTAIPDGASTQLLGTDYD